MSDGVAVSEFKTIDLGPFSAEMTGSAKDSYYGNLQAFVSEHPLLLNYIRDRLKPDSICIDIGANIGVTTLLMCKLCPNGHVYSFEPSPVNAGYLRANLAANDVTNCTVIEAGLGAETATLNFHVSHFGAGSHFVTDAHMGKLQSHIPVPVITLDEFMARPNAPSRLDFIKLDAEGFEPAVLAGAARTIDRLRPPIFMEFNSWSLYYAHRFDPFTFATALWDAFDVEEVQPDGSLKPAGKGTPNGFLFFNMTTRGCVDDVVLNLKPGKNVPTLEVFTNEAVVLRQELAAMRASLSWRLTKLIRRFAGSNY